jgi:hypothetical protein
MLSTKQNDFLRLQDNLLSGTLYRVDFKPYIRPEEVISLEKETNFVSSLL